MNEFRQNAVSRAVWPWTATPTVAQACHRSAARRKALLHFGVAVVVAACFYFIPREPYRVLAGIVLGIGAVQTALCFLLPVAYHRVVRLWAILAVGIGVVITWSLLAPFFFTCFVFGRLILLCCKRDPLCRQFPAPGATCWTPRDRVSERAHYTRQY